MAAEVIPVDDMHLLGENGGEEPSFPEQAVVERRNLLNIVKLTVKVLIESAMRKGRLDDGDSNLQQLFAAIEHSFRHKLKVKRNLLGQKRSFWGVIEFLERSSSEFMESVQNTRSITGIRTSLGKGRAWIRISMMRKKLADNIRFVAENKSVLREWYEPGALMLTDECTVVISGILMGLNVIDYSISLTGDDFDKSVSVIDLSHFLKEGNYLSKSEEIDDDKSDSDDSSQLSTLLDQKAFLEEMNKKLELQVERFQAKTSTLEHENSSMKQQLEALIRSVEDVTLERDEFKTIKDQTEAEMKKKLETTQDDKNLEIETYVKSRSELNDLYLAAQKGLEVEVKLRQQLEQEIEVMRRLKEENETALQLLEKSVHEKQNNIITLRNQLEETKKANIKNRSQLKAAKETNDSNSSTIKVLEAKVTQLSSENRQLETEYSTTKSKLREIESTCSEIGEKLQQVQLAKNTAESELAVEKQWRSSLQTEVQKEKDRVVELTGETKKLKILKQDYSELQEKYACVQETVSEQEIALVEMGRQLSLSQQKIADMKVVSQVMTESKWVDEKEIIGCQICKSNFSVAKRKHHCRNCGGVFCGACSDNTMQLASSAKPVRVCDHCYQLLLERASK